MNISAKKLLYKIIERLFNLYPVGSCYTTSTNTNPSRWLGGTWVLEHKRFRSQWLTTGFTFNNTNTKDGAFAAALNGNTISCRLSWNNKVAISDEDTIIGTFDLEKMGIYAGLHGIKTIGYSDGLNAVCVGTAYLADDSNKNLVIHDWITRAASLPTTTGSNCVLEFTTSVRSAYMLDSFCDEFVWKRTA